MPFKNYYLILGVPREESEAGIRARYRDLVKRLHPDVAGEESTAAFQDVSEAYGVLSDPVHRQQHNRDIRSREGPLIGARAPDRPPAQEPGGPPISIRDFQTVRPSLDALFERILRNFSGAHVPKSEHLEPLEFEVILTPEEAAAGGPIPIELPVFRACRACRGTGRDWLFACVHCAGRGMAAENRLFEIQAPPIRQSEAVLEAPLQGLGIRNLYLRLHLRVSPSAHI